MADDRGKNDSPGNSPKLTKTEQEMFYEALLDVEYEESESADGSDQQRPASA